MKIKFVGIKYLEIQYNGAIEGRKSEVLYVRTLL